jgi:cytochrome P450
MNTPASQSAARPEPVSVPVAMLDRDPHAIFRANRPSTPLLRREDGSCIAIRAVDVEQLITDPRTRQMETESLRLRGIESGALFDFFCAPLPARIICALLGVPESDVPRFTGWVYRVARAIGGSFTRDDVPDIEDAARQLTSYVSDLLASRRTSPQQDFLTQFVRGVEEEGRSRRSKP